MTLHEALTELVVFARENHSDEDPHIAAALKRVEDRATTLKHRQALRSKHNRCVRCEHRRTDGMLCWICMDEAPREVADAFKNAVGLDGMRNATTLVLQWAREGFHERKAA